MLAEPGLTLNLLPVPFVEIQHAVKLEMNGIIQFRSVSIMLPPKPNSSAMNRAKRR